MVVRTQSPAEHVAHELALEGHTPPEEKRFGSRPAWAALRDLGTQLWLDTGDLEAASKLWTDDFSYLTTNNTLVNKEVQKGHFDEEIPRIARRLADADPGLSREDLVSEVGFVINARLALSLVEALDAHVSVELHPSVADSVEKTVRLARRYHAIAPERFVIKVPLTPAGYLSVRQLTEEGVPVNYTVGFSARQNVLAAAFSRPVFVNVFMGRLNSFVSENGLGDGENVGEKATLATQRAIREGRERLGWTSRLIGASMRSAAQVSALAGLDVITMPTAVAEEYLAQQGDNPKPLESRLDAELAVSSSEPEVLSVLWDLPPGFVEGAQALAEEEGWLNWSPGDFVRACADHGLTGLFHDWTPEERAHAKADGKIPDWDRWKDHLRSGWIALDDLMSLSALYAFDTDQDALDDRIHRLLPG